MLHINDLGYRVAGRQLFDRATVAVDGGHRVALVGPNGCGKTTLLRLIVGDLVPDQGQIAVAPRWTVGTVPQDAPGDQRTPLDVVLAADTERAALLAEAEQASDPHRIADIHTRLADIGAHAAPARAAGVLSGLGFDAAAQAQPCATFSGGMRVRVALACALFRQPDLLLLDEPTNHLDLESAMWLEGYLRAYPHTLMLVSHDRGLLNRVANVTIHVNGGRLEAYSGGYDAFETARALKLQRDAATAAKQAAQRKHIQAFVDRFRYKMSKARQVQSRIKALERMQPIVSVIEDRTPTFAFPTPEPLSPPLIAMDDVSVGYGERPVLSRLDLRIDMDDRIAIIGANGNGKSTLVKLLADRLRPMAGKLRKSSKLKIGYFAQHQTEELTVSRTALEEAQARMPMATEEKVRGHLGGFGFAQARADTRIGALSGGEKARLLFALMSRAAPHILLLDEPTNHLDIDSREALVQALNAYDGAVLLVTHDPHLIDLTCDRLWLVADGRCQPFDGGLEDYRRQLAEQRRLERSERRQSVAPGDGAPSRKDQRKASAQQRAALAPLRKRAATLESLVERLEGERGRLEARLADPELYDGPADRLAKLQKRLHACREQLDAAEAEWLDVQHQLEEAAGDDAVLGAA